jgi:pilus assembly protein FimV
MGGAVPDMTKTNFKKRAAALAVASCLSFAPWLAEAAGLGKITVLSGLGQPLRAEIELNASRAELAVMSARLAPQSAFRDAGIDYTTALYDLRFAIDKRSNGTPVLKISSAKPVNDPFMDLLVELTWPAGPIVREYTFLLDPPEMLAKTARPASTADARVVETARAPAVVPTATVRSENTRTAAAAPRAPAESKKPAESGGHVVQQGETLRKIAGETKYEGVSLEQMLVGLFRKNPDAFIGDNINRLKTGAILNIPDQASVAAVPEAEAKKVYVAQASDWNAYRQKLATAAGKGQATQEDGSQSASGKITARVEEKASPAEQTKDQVKVSKAEVAAKGTAVGGRQAAALEEDLIAKDKALKEAQDRLALLEKNVGELQKLVDMKTQRLADLQQQASGKKDEAKPATPVEASKPVIAAEPPKVPEPAPVVEAPKAAEPPKVVEEAKPVEPAKAPEVKQAEAPKKPVVAPEPESDFDPLPLIGGGGLLALLAGYFLLRRRRAEPEPALTAAMPGPSTLGPNSVFRMTGGQSVDTGNIPLQTGDFSQTGPGTIDTDEVDPVAEADVYMAYGRDAQAEEILIEALRKDPHRTAIHAKLLEIYSNRKSVKQFDMLASELYAQTGGVGEVWEKVAVMGATLDPENPLYSSGRSAVSGETDNVSPAAPVDGVRATMVLPGTLGVMAAAAAVDEFAIPELPTEQVPETNALSSHELDFSQAPTDANGDVNTLDFDLGGSGQPLDKAPAPVPEVVASLPEIEAIDFDLGTSSAPFTATEVNSQLPGTETLVMGNVDNGLSQIGLEAESTIVQGDLVRPDAGFIDFEIDTGITAAQTVVDPAAMLMSSDYGSDTIVNPAVTQETMNHELTVADGTAGMAVDYDADAGEFDVRLTESVFIGQPMLNNDFDMTSINLDLGADVSETTQFVDISGNLASDVFQSGQANEEVGTKLALAKAYEEMGDHAQARELLEEVISEGSGELVDQAREIIGRLGG